MSFSYKKYCIYLVLSVYDSAISNYLASLSEVVLDDVTVNGFCQRKM